MDESLNLRALYDSCTVPSLYPCIYFPLIVDFSRSCTDTPECKARSRAELTNVPHGARYEGKERIRHAKGEESAPSAARTAESVRTRHELECESVGAGRPPRGQPPVRESRATVLCEGEFTEPVGEVTRFLIQVSPTETPLNEHRRSKIWNAEAAVVYHSARTLGEAK
jgi:hypothetical protein